MSIYQKISIKLGFLELLRRTDVFNGQPRRDEFSLLLSPGSDIICAAINKDFQSERAGKVVNII